MIDLTHEENSYKFLVSSLVTDGCIHSTDAILQWILKRNSEVPIKVEKINLNEINNWSFNKETGNLEHDSGKFFSIEGLDIQMVYNGTEQWQQPIINQPEIGYLGIITKEFNGVLYFLMQAKIEPGNRNKIQLSPTLQATRSNYTRIHKGKAPLYLDYFKKADEKNILLDQLQSEQGARFYRKRNRNIIIQVDDDLEVNEDFRWLTLGQIKELCLHDDIVNMDTRTVISGINLINISSPSLERLNSELQLDRTHFYDYYDPSGNNRSKHDLNEVLFWFSRLKSHYDLQVRLMPLKDIHRWVVRQDRIEHVDQKFFNVIGVNVQIGNREVTEWQQPLIEPVQQGLCAFLIKKINNTYHFIVQAKMECGNLDILEMAPTVQCLTGNYINKKSLDTLPFLKEVLNAEKDTILADVHLSEEGGRFYHESNRNVIIELKDDEFDELPENYIWLSLEQILFLLKFNNFLNIQARSLISLIKFIH